MALFSLLYLRIYLAVSFTYPTYSQRIDSLEGKLKVTVLALQPSPTKTSGLANLNQNSVSYPYH